MKILGYFYDRAEVKYMPYILPELVVRICKMTLERKQREKRNDHLQWICVKI